MRLLLVDDDPLILAFLRRFLDPHFTTASVTNGREALQWLENNAGPTAVLLDLNMPVMGGREFLAATEKAFPTLGPIVILAGQPPVLAISDPRVVATLVKPIVPADLMEIMALVAEMGAPSQRSPY